MNHITILKRFVHFHYIFFFFLLKLLTSCRYADILAGKLQQKVTAVQKIEATRKLLKEKIEQFKQEKASIQPLVGKLTDQTKMLQSRVRKFGLNTINQEEKKMKRKKNEQNNFVVLSIKLDYNLLFQSRNAQI